VSALEQSVEQQPVQSGAVDETYLFELWEDIWRQRWLIAAITVAFGLLSVGIVLLLPSWYRADVLLAPVDQKRSLGALSQLGSLASLAGISVGTGESGEAIEVLKSRDLTRAFIQEHDLLPILFSKEWDAKAHTWKDPDPERHPDMRDAIRYFNRNVRTVEEDRRTRMVRLSIEWKDAKLAAEWANLLADRINQAMRARALAEAEGNIAYLKSKLSTETTIELHESISEILEREMEKLMLAQGNKDFAFHIIDHAEVAKRRSKPQRALVVVVATMAGTLLAVLFVLRRSLVNRRQPRQLTDGLQASRLQK
jgi:uncharacterized protein involved in exopolysaccharide biosynthesis